MLTSVLPDIKAGNNIVYAIDEVHLLEGDLISHLWGDTKKRLKIPLINYKNRQLGSLSNSFLMMLAYLQNKLKE